ncbi:hypothetical protein ACRALDRAFT_2098140, partial [Sodiomyces alcalophilus JCM 7366]|uniref:uncharacterized protein n=1 Tax=Sodiomyces alcalophilus JCM 7366 TaxID=591952 RepID=UPI0039B4BBCE
RKLRVILPADDPNTNLCKTIFSALANGYPAPIIANWGRDFKKTDKTFGGFGGSHLGKLDGTLAVLETLSSDATPPDERLHPDDLVLIMDAYDVWIQLPPSLLVRRWLAQNDAAAQRIRDGWSETAEGALPPPRQSVILSTQKKCWPTKADGSDTHCDILPESTARKDLYGPDTDKPDGPLHFRRPRYINSGSMLGPARDAIRILRRAHEKVEASRAAGLNLFSDQGILGEILGEQELWRKEQRERNARLPDVQPGGPDTWEYGMGLDYVQDLFVPTVFMEDDGEYLVLADQAAVDKASKEHKVDPPRLSGVPEDILTYASAPLVLAGVETETETESKADDDERRNTTGWADVPLYADYWSTQVPVGVHHNAHRGGMKGRRLREWWSKTWYFPYLRDIVAARSQAVDTREPLVTIPAAEIDGSKDGQDLVYWAPEADMRKPLPRTFNPDDTEEDGLPEAGWDTLCQAVGKDEDDWWDVIFQDDKGPLGQDQAEGSESESKSETETSR